jgi:hypothetical protein
MATNHGTSVMLAAGLKKGKKSKAIFDLAFNSFEMILIIPS